MFIGFVGKPRLDSENGRVEYQVLIGKESLHCSIDAKALCLLCDSCRGPIDCFGACRMIILECTRRKYDQMLSFLAESIRISSQSYLLPA